MISTIRFGAIGIFIREGNNLPKNVEDELRVEGYKKTGTKSSMDIYEYMGEGSAPVKNLDETISNRLKLDSVGIAHVIPTEDLPYY